MSKGHRDNHKARKKRGSVAFEKKKKRRTVKKPKCQICGEPTRPRVLFSGLCPRCVKLILKREEVTNQSRVT